ncbi:hypothetical protein D0817_00810 [Flavobacterium cupreum]|uniref:Uncharacterized protein n=1 Tax=Flavobacterium cupreum TaxID=2133766 RepID=A0A434ACU1_9FLAO|nr:hypothetical protein [Flavobacterium cupreum]RUT72191.1 hypothetical protein D0817_00810 [Flavobacterium cupreum]
MEIKVTRSARSFFSIRTNAGILLLLFLTVNCTRREPAFTVKGDPAVTKDIKVNVEAIRDEGKTISTVYYNGRSYEFDNQNVLRYAIYVSYKDSFFYSTAFDNLHDRIKGSPLNEIVITKKEGIIHALYRPLKESDTVGGTPLQPSRLYFTNSPDKDTKKQKFTNFYKSK